MPDGKRYKSLIDPLVSYTCSRFQSVNLQKLAVITFFYEIIREAIADLHCTHSKKLNKDAQEYFDGKLFEFHCVCLSIPKKLMLHIVHNADNYLDKPLPFTFDKDYLYEAYRNNLANGAIYDK